MSIFAVDFAHNDGNQRHFGTILVSAIKYANEMNAVSMNNLWRYLQGLSLTASNQRWLGERLIEASASQNIATEEELKLKKLNALFGVWNDKDGEQIENSIREARIADYEREVVTFDE